MPEKILFITNQLRPSDSAAALQSAMLAYHLSMNCGTHVISTTESPEDMGNSKHYYVPRKPHSPVRTRIENLYSKFGKNMKLCFPDSRTGWVEAATEMARSIIEKEQIELVITWSMPVSTHQIGLRLKEMNPRIIWVASNSDPISINPYQNYISNGLKNRLKEFEKNIYEKADIITHTNSFVIAEYEKLYPIYKGKHYVLPNMFETMPVTKTRRIELDSGPMLISYAGRLYGQRNPAPLFKALQMFISKFGKEKIRLNLIGVGESHKLNKLIKKYDISDMIVRTSFLERNELAKELSKSHLLVSIDGDFSGNNLFLASKNLDYISSIVPTLGITKKGPTVSLIEETNSGIWVQLDDAAGIYNALVEHYKKIQGGYDYVPKYEEIMKYHSKYVADTFYAFVSGTSKD